MSDVPSPRSKNRSAPFVHRYIHELVLTESTDDVLAAAVPVVEAGLAADDPVILSMPADHATAVLDLLGQPPGVTVLPRREMARRPGTELRTFRTLADRFTDRMSQPASRLRVVNELPADVSWRDWCRYEAATNIALADLPVLGICIYETASLPAVAIRHLRRAHPFVRSGTTRTASPDFEPLAVGWETFDAPPDPLEREQPTVELLEPSLAAGRAAVRGFVRRADLPADDVEALVFATNEALANALAHGCAPVRLSVWVAPGRAFVRVHDTGPGPRNCFPDIVQTGRLPGGMWLSGQMVDVTHARSESGYAVGLAIGQAPDVRTHDLPRTRPEEP